MERVCTYEINLGESLTGRSGIPMGQGLHAEKKCLFLLLLCFWPYTTVLPLLSCNRQFHLSTWLKYNHQLFSQALI